MYSSLTVLTGARAVNLIHNVRKFMKISFILNSIFGISIQKTVAIFTISCLPFSLNQGYEYFVICE